MTPEIPMHFADIPFFCCWFISIFVGFNGLKPTRLAFDPGSALRAPPGQDGADEFCRGGRAGAVQAADQRQIRGGDGDENGYGGLTIVK